MLLFHNYPLTKLQTEAEQLDQVFNKVRLTPEQARINRRMYAAISEEIGRRMAEQVQALTLLEEAK
jgi:hypothetical protein